MSCAVLGAGSWGTAFAQVLTDAGNDVRLWSRRDDLAAAVEGVDVVAFAIPSQALRANLTQWAPALPKDAVLVSLMKGIELSTTKRMSEVIADVTGADASRIAVLTGPNLAGEIVERQPAASVVACSDESVAAQLQSCFHAPYFRPYTSTDVIGCEIGGAYKNVVAIAVGMAVGLGFGDNTRASLITRGLAETARLAVALGANPLTLMGLAGLGDLVATCDSPLSRNRSYGEQLGRGRSAADIEAGGVSQVVEGAKSASAIRALAASHSVDAPLAIVVDEVINGRMTPSEVMEALLSRTTKAETA